MADLISRSDAICAITKKRFAEEIIGVLVHMPSVDAEPVRHGEWKMTDAYPHRLYCLRCYRSIVPNVKLIDKYSIPTDYCPNCGAKMDGRVEDTCKSMM